jgi:membrane protease YdiL (CAAX protease family)
MMSFQAFKRDGKMADITTGSSLRAFVKSHALIAFFGLTFLVTWSLWAILIFAGIPLGVPGYLLFLLAASAPSLTAILLSAILEGRQGLVALFAGLKLWRSGLGWYVVVLLSPLAVMLAAIGIHILLGGVAPAFSMLSKAYLLPVAFVQVFLMGGPLEEELGWRGFALPHLQSRYTALVSSVILGGMWGLWHVPAFWIPWSSQHDLPMLPFVLHDIALGVLFTWVYNSTRGSLWMVMLFHTAVNVWSAFIPVLPSAGSVRPFELTVALLYLFAGTVVLVCGPRKLNSSRSD